MQFNQRNFFLTVLHRMPAPPQPAPCAVNHGLVFDMGGGVKGMGLGWGSLWISMCS